MLLQNVGVGTIYTKLRYMLNESMIIIINLRYNRWIDSNISVHVSQFCKKYKQLVEI